MRTCTTWLQYMVVPYYWIKTRNLHVARATGRELQTLEIVQHCKAVLLSGIADFQKGQCLFWLAIAIAGIVAIWNPSQALGATSIAGTRLNLSAISTICSLAVTCITCGFYLTTTHGKFSWYVTVYAGLTLALCVGIEFHIATIRPAHLAVKGALDTSTVSACGHVPPTVYCDNNYVWKYSLLGQTDPVVGLRLSSMIATAVQAAVSIAIGVAAVALSYSKQATKHSKGDMWFRVAAETILAGLVAFFFVDIATAIKTRVGGAIVAAWGFGQIIAVTIWWPILIESIIATLSEQTRGIQNFDYRLTLSSWPGQVVRASKNLSLSYESYGHST